MLQFEISTTCIEITQER